MYQCPVCGKENTAPQCTCCGFDISRDYEGYPTLASLGQGLPSRAAAGKKLKDMHRCKGCGGMLFYLNSIKGFFICAHCGKEVPTGAPKANPTPVLPVKPVSSQKVITYDAYMKALEQKYLDSGKLPLSQNQIETFLRENQLDKRFSIRTEDIRQDLETIYAKHKPQSSPNQVSSYENYIKKLESLYIQNGKRPLTPQQIMEFIQTNRLGKQFGITAADVQKDLRTIYAKYKINTHDGYMKALETLYIQNGKTPLSLSQIQNFWTSNDLFNQLGITVGDIQQDLRTIAEKHQQYSNLASVLKQKSGKDATSLSSLLSQLGKKK